MKAIVVGCGVSGLSCAIRLAEAGSSVEIWADRFGEDTTSAVAAAIWYPYKAGPTDKVVGWARASYEAFRLLVREPGSGVELRQGRELFAGAEPASPWRGLISPWRALEPEDLPRGYASGYAFAVPVVEMPLYLPFLRRRFESRGGRVVARRVESLGEALELADLVVNCTGLEARALTGDRGLFPIRGQVVLVERGAIERFTLDDYNPLGLTYVVPRSRDCVLGGTAEEGSSELAIDARSTASILARCAALEPRLASARVLSQRVGLRPGRATVRLELERPAPGKRLIHDYGHGGAGVTLSWGCADEVLALSR